MASQPLLHDSETASTSSRVSSSSTNRAPIASIAHFSNSAANLPSQPGSYEQLACSNQRLLERPSRSSKPLRNHSGPHSQEFVCGGGAAVVEVCTTFPIHQLIFRQQLQGIYLKEAIQQLVREGHRLIYRGLLPPLLQKVPCRALMFGTFEEYQRLLGCGDRRWERFTGCHATAAFMAGTTEAILTPFERVQVLLQTPNYHHRFKNTWQAYGCLKSYGIREYYRGLTPILLRNGTSNILFFAFRGPLKHAISERKEASFAADFVTGAVLGATLSTVFYPVNVVKTRMQCKLGGDFKSPWRIFRKIWIERNRSVKELFRGVHLNYTRSLLTWGITNTVYEYLEKKWFLESLQK